MIEFIKGKLDTLNATYAVVDCGGVGYMANISLNTYSALEGKEEAKLYIHEVIREDAYQLFGFATTGEREVFRLLTSVSGVGAVTARLMVSAMTPAELKSVIMGENVNALKGIKGLGQKTSERIIVELKDKIGKLDIEGGATASTLPGLAAAASPVKDDTLQALEAMGYNKAQASKVIDKILSENPDFKVQDVFKMALKMLR